MKPEVNDALRSATKRLWQARELQRLGMSRIAAREAYLAAFQAVQGLIFQAEGKVAKTHSGARTVFHRAFRSWPPITAEATTVLDSGFEQKTLADYGSIADDELVSVEAAEKTLMLAGHLIDQISAALTDTPDTD